jgi:hypothetical protein
MVKQSERLAMQFVEQADKLVLNRLMGSLRPVLATIYFMAIGSSISYGQVATPLDEIAAVAGTANPGTATTTGQSFTGSSNRDNLSNNDRFVFELVSKAVAAVTLKLANDASLDHEKRP